MSYTFVTYVANGVAEIQSKHENLTGIEYHIIKTLQISQQEKHHLVLLTAEKRYRISVSYLCKWPIKQDKVEMKIPDNIVQHTEVTVTKGNSISTKMHIPRHCTLSISRKIKTGRTVWIKKDLPHDVM